MRPQASEEKRSMDYFAGLDVSVKETSVCILDDAGRIVKEVKVASEPQALLKVLGNPTYRFKRIGLEAGPLSQRLFSALAEAELPVICVETRHMQAVLKAQINKTDRNDARGSAQMMRVGMYRPVHVKTLRSQKLRMLLTHRKLLQSKSIANRGKIASYDPEQSGSGLLFITRDTRITKTTWDMVRAFGGAGVKPYSTTGTVLDRISSGEHLIAYNMIGPRKML
jgi:Transposase